MSLRSCSQLSNSQKPTSPLVLSDQKLRTTTEFRFPQVVQKGKSRYF